MKIRLKSFDRFYRRAALLFLPWLLMSGLAFSQSNVRLSGRVYDADSGAPLPGVVVELEGTSYGAVSTTAGDYAVENIPAGRYTVIFAMLGYRTQSYSQVEISADTPLRLSASLYPQPISIDSVNITANRDQLLPDAGLEGEKIVLSGRDVQAYRTLGLAQMLQQAAGVQVESTGGGASRSLIRIHGSSSAQVLVLLDGQRLNNPQTGEVDLNDIPMSEVERVEIVRQGNSALYGGGAFAGVVSFHTRRVQPQSYAELSSQAGSFQSASGRAAGSVTRGPARFLASYQQDYSRQDFRYRYEGEQWTRENAYYRNQKGFARFDVDLTRQRISFNASLQRGRQGLPSPFFEEQRVFGASVLSTGGAFQINHRWLWGKRSYLESALSYHRLDQSYNNTGDPSPFTRFLTHQVNRTYEARADAFWALGSTGEFRMGGNLLREELRHQNLLFPAQSFGDRSRSTSGVYSGIEAGLPVLPAVIRTLKLRGVFRFESSLGRPAEGYPLLGANLVMRDLSWISFAYSWARAVRYPDFNSLFWKGDARARGNPDLRPERKSLWNFSTRFNSPRAGLPTLSIYYYSENISDLIFWQRTVSGIWEPRNEARARKKGVDVELDQEIFAGHLRLKSAYSWVEARNGSSEPNRQNKRIVFIPAHTLNSSLWAAVGPLNAMLVSRVVSEREVVPSNTPGIQLSGYHLWDASIGYSFGLGAWGGEIRGAVRNLGGADYQLLRGYPMPGREYTLSIEIKYQFTSTQ